MPGQHPEPRAEVWFLRNIIETAPNLTIERLAGETETLGVVKYGERACRGHACRNTQCPDHSFTARLKILEEEVEAIKNAT